MNTGTSEPSGQKNNLKAINIKKLLLCLGLINVSCFVARAILSYGMVSIAPFGRVQANEAEAMSFLAARLSFLGGSVSPFLMGQTILRNEIVFALAYCLPLVISSVVFLVLFARLSHSRDSLTEDTPRLLFKWAVLFAAVSLVTTPLLVHDFWLSIAWGRMVVAGSNPYHTDLTVELARGLPLDYFNHRMTYGPLWGVISTFLTWISGGNPFFAAVLFKLVLGGAWIGALLLIWQMLTKYSFWHQCVGLAIFGWLPVSVIDTAGDGHNDIVMVFLMLLWLFLLQRGSKIGASLALAASVLIKYTTAPLFLLDLLYARYFQKQTAVKYAPRLISAGAIGIVFVGLFYRSRTFFNPPAEMRNWNFLSPELAILSFSKLLRIPDTIGSALVWLMFAFCFSITIYFVIRFVRSPSQEGLWQAVTAIMAAVTFSVVGHVWPWFLIWALAGAALVPGSPLTRWVLGVALVAPFPTFFLVEFPNSSAFVRREVTAMVFYALSILWFFLAPPRWFREKENTAEAAPAHALGEGALV